MISNFPARTYRLRIIQYGCTDERDLDQMVFSFDIEIRRSFFFLLEENLQESYAITSTCEHVLFIRQIYHISLVGISWKDNINPLIKWIHDLSYDVLL